MRFYPDIPEAELADNLKSLGRRARTLLAECVEHQGVRRTKASKTAESLNDAGYIFIREEGAFFDAQVLLTPSLLGEEALLALEKLEEGQAHLEAQPSGVD